MKKINNLLLASYFFILIFINFGCAMKEFIKINEFKETTIPESMINISKDEIMQEWGKPDRIYTVHDRLEKYGADELWIYRPENQRKRYDSIDEKRMYVSEGVDEYLYFKNGHLIKWEDLVWGDF